MLRNRRVTVSAGTRDARRRAIVWSVRPETLRILCSVIVAAALWVPLYAVQPAIPARSLPAAVSDDDFWAMVEGFSEPGGSFASDNLLSNEIAFQQVIPDLRRSGQAGAYLGVGPEQNFTYIAALKPAMAFVIDIRRQNLLLHLMYKAIAELSATRAEFMSRLFARPVPGGLAADATARALFDAFESMPRSDDLARANRAAIIDRLERGHRFPLTEADERGIADTYKSLSAGGPGLHGDFGGGPWIPSYAELMSQTDLAGVNHSYLASEENFGILKAYEMNNLIVPIVGDFSGERAIRSVGRYLKEHDATVATFYMSNVEEYLFKNGTWGKFARNVSTLPVGGRSMFIRTYFTHTEAGLRTLVDSMQGLLNAFMGGDIQTYNDVVLRSKSPAR
jgi:hypothetical protein